MLENEREEKKRDSKQKLSSKCISECNFVERKKKLFDVLHIFVVFVMQT